MRSFQTYSPAQTVSATSLSKSSPLSETVQEDEQAVCSVPPMQEGVPAAVSLPLFLWLCGALRAWEVPLTAAENDVLEISTFRQSVKAFKDLPSVTESNLSASLREVAERSGLSGRTLLSSLLVFDEIYDFLMDLGVLDRMSKMSSAGPDTSGQTPNLSWANRLMRTGTRRMRRTVCGLPVWFVALLSVLLEAACLMFDVDHPERKSHVQRLMFADGRNERRAVHC